MNAKGRAEWGDIAASSYRAYASVTGGKNFKGDPMPSFEELSPTIKLAWEAAVRHSYNMACSRDDQSIIADEPGWFDWAKARLNEGAVNERD
jgi:hypothetical protein